MLQYLRGLDTLAAITEALASVGDGFPYAWRAEIGVEKFWRGAFGVDVEGGEFVGDKSAVMLTADDGISAFKGKQAAVEELASAYAVQHAGAGLRAFNWPLCEQPTSETQDADVWVTLIAAHGNWISCKGQHIAEFSTLPALRAALVIG